MITLNFEKEPLKKGTWSSEEDQRLLAYINRYGIWNWNEMPKAAGLSRSGKSCRLRWMNYLRPDVKRGNFSNEEDKIILDLHKKLGNRWSAIAAKLPGRTDNEIKNHWHTHLKKRCAVQETKLQRLEIPEEEIDDQIFSENGDLAFFSSPNASSSEDCKGKILISSSELSPSDYSSISSSPEDNELDHRNQTTVQDTAISELHGNFQYFQEQPFLVEDLDLMQDQMWLDEEYINYPYLSPGDTSINSSEYCYQSTEENFSSSESSQGQLQSSPMEVFSSVEDNGATTYQMWLDGSVYSCTNSQIAAGDDSFEYPSLWSDSDQAVEENFGLSKLSEKSLPMEGLQLTDQDYGVIYIRGLWQ